MTFQNDLSECPFRREVGSRTAHDEDQEALAAALRKRKIPNCGVVVCSVSADGKITRAALGFAPTGSKPLVAATKKAKERTKKPKAKQVVPEPTQAD